MTRLVEVESHIASVGDLLDIVGAMRSLASMRVQEAHRALPGVRRYGETMAGAIGTALLLMPEATPARSRVAGRRALVVFTAEHGFVGGFNERVIEAAEQAPADGDTVFVLGTRGGVRLEERGRPVAWAHPMATRPEGAPETARRLAVALYHAVAAGQIARAEMVFARHRRGRALAIERRALFPVEPAAFKSARRPQPPLHNLPAEMLFEKLVADYVLALLTEAAVESIASENAARFSAMEAARDNLAKKLELLRQDARQIRQEEITTELLDLVTGTEALGQ
jgi:F-type H+-transporting ATPase subunit gamma